MKLSMVASCLHSLYQKISLMVVLILYANYTNVRDTCEILIHMHLIILKQYKYELNLNECIKYAH